MKQIRKIFIGLFIILVILMAGCSNTTNNQKYVSYEEEPISISGTNVIRTINSENIVILTISGVNHNIKIAKDTRIKEIIVSGSNIIISIPENQKPKIVDSGTNVNIQYY